MAINDASPTNIYKIYVDANNYDFNHITVIMVIPIRQSIVPFSHPLIHPFIASFTHALTADALHPSGRSADGTLLHIISSALVPIQKYIRFIYVIKYTHIHRYIRMT